MDFYFFIDCHQQQNVHHHHQQHHHRHQHHYHPKDPMDDLRSLHRSREHVLHTHMENYSIQPGDLYILYPHHPAKNVIFMLNLFGQVLINVWTIVAIMSNIYLWIYLRSLSLHSIALKEVQQCCSNAF